MGGLRYGCKAKEKAQGHQKKDHEAQDYKEKEEAQVIAWRVSGVDW